MDDKDRSTLDRLSLEADTDSINLKQLYYFHAVATEGTIARAAKKLSVSQSTVSEQLKALEQYLGEPLFERHRSGVRLNQSGRRAYEHTKAMFRSVRRLLHEVGPARDPARWVLEVGLCPTVSRTFAAERFVPLFKLEGVAPRVRQASYEALMEQLLSGELDLLLSENRPASVDSQKVGLQVLIESPLVIVGAPSMAEQLSFPNDLSKVPFLHYPRTSSYRWDVEDFLAEHGLAPEILGEVDDVALLAVAATQGLCCAAVPRSVVTYELLEGRLVELGEVHGGCSRVYAQFQSVKTPEVVRRALDSLLEHVAPNAPVA